MGETQTTDEIEVGPNGRPIVKKGKYSGWESGCYMYSNKWQRLMTAHEEKEYWDRFNHLKKELEIARENGVQSTSFTGIDGIEYQLAPGLEGILEIEKAPFEACRRFSEGQVTWEDLKSFLVYFPYSRSHPGGAVLTKEGNAYPDSTYPMHPREDGQLEVAALSDLITSDQSIEILRAQELVLKSLKLEGKTIVWGAL